MSDEHAHHDLVFGVQALRRVVEREACDLGGALGVRADIYPHQVATVHRVLTAPTIRHLLADEVGLGKTVQALMIVNALRIQNPLLRVMIIVPNELRAQWRDEIWTRGHQAPIEVTPEGDADRRLRLAWPQSLKGSLGEVSPTRYDLLIVDEFHSLQRDIQARILAVAAEFRGLLLISATPPLQDPQRRRDVLRMLEPAWIELMQLDEGADPLAALIAQEERAETLLARDANSDEWEAAELSARPPGSMPRARTLAAMAWSTFRRIVRTRREDYRAYMPVRRHSPLTVEPTDAERERQRLMWQYFHHLPTLSLVVDPLPLAQRVIRSSASLHQRVTFFLRFHHEREGLLAQVAPLLDRALGDSRFEALVDLLDEIWRHEEGASVIIAAGDNLTVDQLKDQLPLVLEGLDAEGAIAHIKNQGQEIKGADSLADPDDEIERAVERFRSRGARVLIAAQVGKLGLNLQFSRHIVLYSVPWDPQEVEQWIGRVDRIGNPTVRGHGESKAIMVYTIAQRGLVDERVREVLAASSIFERSISLDGDMVNRVTHGIRAAGLGEAGDWHGLVKGAQEIARAHEELGSPLRGSLPWTPGAAAELCARLVEAPPVEPAAGSSSPGKPLLAREDALKGWMRALDAVGEYRVRRRREFGGRIIRYHYSEFGKRWTWKLRSRAVLKEVLPDADEAKGRDIAYIDRRAHIGLPPRREVELHRGEPQPLYYLNHGSPLHDDLVGAWHNVGENGAAQYELLLPIGHPAASRLSGELVQVLVGSLDPCIEEHLLNEALTQAAAEVTGAGALAVAKRVFEDLRVCDMFWSDQRVVRSLLPMQLLYGAFIVHPRGRQRVPDEVIRALLLPDVYFDDPKPRTRSWQAPQALAPLAEQASSELMRELTGEGRQRWSNMLPAFDEAVRERRYLVGCDLTAEQELLTRRLELAEANLMEAEGALEAAEAVVATAADDPARRERGELAALKRQAAGQRAQVTRAKAALDEAEQRFVDGDVRMAARAAWLNRMATHPREATLKPYRSALIKIGTLPR